MLPEQTSAELEIIDEFIKEEASSRVSRSSAAGRTPILVSRSSNPEPCVRPETFTGPRPSHVMPDVRNFTAPIPEMPPSCSQAELSEMLHTVTLGNPPSNPASGVLVSRSTAPRGHGNWIPSETLQTSRSQHTDIKNNALEAFLQRPTPKLRITEQPKQRGMRFRYECEGRSAGSILGANSTDQNKTLPTIELSDCDGVVEVTVVTCLVWKDWPHRIHPHGLVGKDCHDGICEVTIKPKSNRKHSYNNLGVQCVKKKEIEEAVVKKINMGFDPFHAGHWKNQEEVDMNVVRLCFQASYQNSRGETHHLEPVLSDPIYDKKSTNTSELKICRINKEMGQCAGGEEVYLLCDKVQKEDIAVVFHTESWEAKADFSQADVHRQIAIVFKTPSYQDLDISKPVTVEVCLERVTDKVRSDPFYFTYLPKDHDVYGVDVKRKRGFPDGIGELSSSDPHGIEAKRRKKKPNYKDHCNPVPKAVLLPPSYGLSVESREYQQSFAFCEDNMFQTQPENTFADFIDSSSFANNYFLETNWPSSDHDMPVMNFQESFLDNFEDYGQPQIPFPLLSPPAENTAMNSDAGPPNTASLIANGMFPSQYKEEEFPFSQCLGLQEREELT